METSVLGTYLHDHLAGASAALQLLAGIEDKYAGEAVGLFASALREEIEWERTQLEILANSYPVKTATPRRAAAWLAEKALEGKLLLDGAGDSFRLFESLEALSLGIAGKRLLWRALRQQARSNTNLAVVDYRKLIAMAVRQRIVLEPFRLSAAGEAFGHLGTAAPSLDATHEKTFRSAP